jgi:segregation and condensation protein A
MPLYLHEQTQRIAADVELEHLSLFKLLRSYQQVLDRFKLQNAKIVHTVVRHNYSMEERHIYIMQRLQETDSGRLDFIDLFEECENRLHAIYTFLATLELLQQGKVHLQLNAGFNNFSISAAELVG